MCNNYRLNVDLATIAGDFSELRIKVEFSEGVPNVPARDDIRITDVAPIARASSSGGVDIVQRRWSWPGPTGKPVYNFRSEGRAFGENRCLILADGFYEFTDPAPTEGAPKKRRKDKWLFTMNDHRWFAIAGIYRQTGVGEAFTMLTTEPGSDIAPYHHRQVVVLGRDQWMRWLDPRSAAADVLRPTADRALKVNPASDLHARFMSVYRLLRDAKPATRKKTTWTGNSAAIPDASDERRLSLGIHVPTVVRIALLIDQRLPVPE